MDIISKYVILCKFGGAYTMESIENMEYLDFLYLQICMSNENKAAENERNKAKMRK